MLSPPFATVTAATARIRRCAPAPVERRRTSVLLGLRQSVYAFLIPIAIGTKPSSPRDCGGIVTDIRAATTVRENRAAIPPYWPRTTSPTPKHLLVLKATIPNASSTVLEEKPTLATPVRVTTAAM